MSKMVISWVEDKRFSTHSARVQHVEELDKLINHWTTPRLAEDVMNEMQPVSIAAGVVETPADVFEDPQLKYRKYFQLANHPEIGDCYLPDWPFKLTETPAELDIPPLFGQDTHYICTEILKMSDDEFARLVDEGIFE